VVVVTAHLDFKPITVAEFRANGGEDLMRANYAEMEPRPEVRKLEVQWDLLSMLEEKGHTFSYGVWQDDKLVGYLSAVYSVGALHYADWHVVEVCVIYVDPRFRNLRVVTELMRMLQEDCRKLGLDSIFWKAREGSPFQRYLDRKEPFLLLEHTYEELI
jgi:ribosomal protein S18 acetylase RimI-like enzyme